MYPRYARLDRTANAKTHQFARANTIHRVAAAAAAGVRVPNLSDIVLTNSYYASTSARQRHAYLHVNYAMLRVANPT